VVHDRIKKLRERINRREKNTRAKRRAKARRIEKGDPKSKSEKAQVSAKEAKKLAGDAKQLIATETGISTSESEKTIREGAALLRDAGDDLSQLDADGDGDTDILSGVDPIQTNRGSGGADRPEEFGEDTGEEITDPGEPVMSFDDLREI